MLKVVSLFKWILFNLMIVPAQAQVGVSLTDLQQYKVQPGPAISGQLSNQFSQSVRSLLPSRSQVERISPLFLQHEASPYYQWLSTVTLKDNRVLWFQVLTDTQSILQITQIPTEQIQITSELDLIERKYILRDSRFGLTIVLPVGVGAFDEGVLNFGEISLLTPRFKSGSLKDSATITRREKPRYFANKPFVRIVDGVSNEGTAIGFHTEVNDSFVRGFDSRGCMRMRDTDLYFLHDIVKYSLKNIPITVAYRTNTSEDHPYPKRNSGFKTVFNAGTQTEPKMVLDRDNLVKTAYKNEKPPVDLLVDSDQDHFEDLFEYSGLKSYERQRKVHSENCRSQDQVRRAKALSSVQTRIDEINRRLAMPVPQAIVYPGMSEKEIEREQRRQQKEKEQNDRRLNSEKRELQRSLERSEKTLSEQLNACLKQGERVLSTQDKIYRWWTH